MRFGALSSTFVAGILLAGGWASAQTTRITCSSDDMRMHSCRVGPNQGIRFVKQRSQAKCVPDQTFGIRHDSVWVTSGCRADFEVINGDQGGYGAYNDRDQDRDRDRDRDHDRDRDRDADQRGYDQGGYGQGGYGQGSYGRNNPAAADQNAWHKQFGYIPSRTGTPPVTYLGKYDDGKSTCSAQVDAGPIYCQTGGGFTDAYLVKQNGRGPCVRGRSWGVDQFGLWVANGCAGQFKIEKH